MWRIYNVSGYVTVVIALLAGTFLFPLHGDYVLSFGVTFGYYTLLWLLVGLYLGDVVHLGLAHRSLDVKPWFMYLITILNNTIGMYLNAKTWINRHRLHHLHADTDTDPNKRPDDGFWTTFWHSQVPYPCVTDTLTDPLFRTRLFSFLHNWYFAIASQFISFGLLWLVTQSWKFTLTLWLGRPDNHGVCPLDPELLDPQQTIRDEAL